MVFEETHAKIFELIGDGLVDGLRIDHIDGLADPRGYCRRLRRRVDRLNAGRPSEAVQDHVPIYVERSSPVASDCMTTGAWTAPPATSS